MTVKELQKCGYQWRWSLLEFPDVEFFTDVEGNGIFVKPKTSDSSQQLAGTMQFQSCQTYEEMYSKVAENCVQYPAGVLR